MSQFNILRTLPFALLLIACGPTDGDGGGGGADGGVCEPVAQTESSCSGGIDEDCDGNIDCADPDCSFDPVCQGSNTDGCGEADHSGDPLAIPDGNGQSYQTAITITGFDPGQKLMTADGFTAVCVTMEHTWLRDLAIELECPSGQKLLLQEFLGHEGGEVFMGQPNDNDGTDPEPGVGGQYCWKADAVNPSTLDYANANAPAVGTLDLPEGDYRPSGNWGDLIGCDLNGDWIIRATDDWASDNGYIFEWGVSFNPNIISDCGEWID